MNLIVGLTGGIGSGKTTVANLFADLGAAIVDTDAIAHELTGPRGAAMPQIAQAFGMKVLQPDGSLDRAGMRQLCFSDPLARKRLESILHPMIRHESSVRCNQAHAAPYILLVVPLLIESGAYQQQVQRILVVDCDESVQVSRVMQRSGMTAEAVRAIMVTQATRAERLAAADDVVNNEGPPENLLKQVSMLHQRYTAMARGVK